MSSFKDTGSASIIPLLDPLVRGLAESAAVTRFADCIELPVAILSSMSKNRCTRFLHINPSFTELTGFQPAEIVGEPASLLMGEDTDLASVRTFRDEIETTGCSFTTVVNYRRDGSPYEVIILGARLRPHPDDDADLIRFASFSILLRDVDLVLPKEPYDTFVPVLS